jgi:hypothetical protein
MTTTKRRREYFVEEACEQKFVLKAHTFESTFAIENLDLDKNKTN